MVVQVDTPDNFCLNTPKGLHNGKPIFFAAVQRKKNYVTFHLFPVYVVPALLQTISPQLKRRMQGKGCFNFTTVDVELFAQLDQLTAAGEQAFRHRGWV